MQLIEQQRYSCAPLFGCFSNAHQEISKITVEVAAVSQPGFSSWIESHREPAIRINGQSEVLECSSSASRQTGHALGSHLMQGLPESAGDAAPELVVVPLRYLDLDDLPLCIQCALAKLAQQHCFADSSQANRDERFFCSPGTESPQKDIERLQLVLAAD